MFEGLVVAGEPVLGSDRAAVDVVSHEVFLSFGRLPLYEHRRLGVSGGHDLPGSRGDACSRENTLLKSNRFVIRAQHQLQLLLPLI